MHICHLSTVHCSDELRVFQKQCVSLAAEGIEVTFIAPSETDYVEKGVNIIGIRPNCSKFSRLFVQPFRVLRNALKVDADIYQFHDFELWPIGIVLRLLGHKVIADIHEDVPGQLMQREWVPNIIRRPLSLFAQWFENLCAKNVSGIITADDVLANRFITLNANVQAIKNYPLAVILPETESNSDRFLVSSLGGAFKERCAEIVIGASRQLAHVDFEIAGGLSANYQDLNWESTNCRYLGYISSQKVLEQYSKSDVLIVMFNDAPNHQSIKSNRFFEAMYAGKPVIVSNLPKWKKFIDDYQCGLYVDLSCPQELSTAISTLEGDQVLAKRMGDNGKKAVDEYFSWSSQVPKLLKMYHKILHE